MTKEELIESATSLLRALANNGLADDPHTEADNILLRTLRIAGYGDVADAYIRLSKSGAFNDEREMDDRVLIKMQSQPPGQIFTIDGGPMAGAWWDSLPTPSCPTCGGDLSQYDDDPRMCKCEDCAACFTMWIEQAAHSAP